MTSSAGGVGIRTLGMLELQGWKLGAAEGVGEAAGDGMGVELVTGSWVEVDDIAADLGSCMEAG